jgi:hypothetical protein
MNGVVPRLPQKPGDPAIRWDGDGAVAENIPQRVYGCRNDKTTIQDRDLDPTYGNSGKDGCAPGRI